MDFDDEFLAAEALNNIKYEFSKGISNITRARRNDMKDIDDLFIRYYFDALMFDKKFNMKNFKISYIDIENLSKQNHILLPSRKDIEGLERYLSSKYTSYIMRKKKYNVKKIIQDNYVTYDIFPTIINVRMIEFSIRRFQEIQDKFIGNKADFDKIAALMILRYSILGTENQHLSFPPTLIKRFNIDIELFGTPLNTTALNFCSPFYDIERYFGSLGSFFDFDMLSNKSYTFDPPYIEEFMNAATKKLLSQLDNIKNFFIIINIPVWDSKTQKEQNFKDYDMPFETYELLKKSKYLHSETIALKFTNKYYNYFTGRYLPVSNTHLMILTDREINFDARDINTSWKNLTL